MRGQEEITNSDDIIDGRALQDRIDHLEGERESIADSLAEAQETLKEAEHRWAVIDSETSEEVEALGEALTEGRDAVKDWQGTLAEWDASEEGIELTALRALAENVDTRDATLIRESYFPRHARDLANDLHPRDAFDRWPFTCIDWEQAAKELASDYSSLDFDGTTYYVRD